MTPTGSNHPAPGWYPDASAYADQRYWDGTQWTDHYILGGKAVPPPPAVGRPSTTPQSSTPGAVPSPYASGESGWHRAKGYWTVLPNWGRAGIAALVLILLIAAAAGDGGNGTDPEPDRAAVTTDAERERDAERAADEARAEEARAAKAAKARAAKARARRARARRARIRRARARELRAEKALAAEREEQRALEAERAAEQAAADAAAQETSSAGCEPGYSPCVPSYPPDVNCADTGPVTVTGSDPHGLDADGDGVACGGD